MAGFFKTMIVLILSFTGALFYETDGTFSLESDYDTLSTVEEVGDRIHAELSGDIFERPDRISFEYLTTGDDFDLTTERILDILHNGGYNAKSVKNIHLQLRGQLLHQFVDHDRVVVHLYLNYIDDLNDEVYIQSEVDRILSTIIQDSMSDFQKIEAINQYITQHIQYDHSDRKNGQSVRVALERGTGVCTANARLAGRMLDQVGIRNIGVSGQGDGNGDGEWVAHAWNKVNLGGTWYNLDTTWNTHRSVGGLHGEYLFFLVSDDYLSQTHIPHSNENLPIAANRQFERLY